MSLHVDENGAHGDGTVEDAQHSNTVMIYPFYKEYARHPLSEAPSPRKFKIANDRPVRIYCDGVYDLLHYGHSQQLEQAKLLFPAVHLLVGVHSDAVVQKYKGPTLMTEHERYEGVRHCRHVDEVVENAPWIITEEFLAEHRIDYVAHDDLPYTCASAISGDLYKHLKDIGRFIPTRRTLGVSTTQLIGRVLDDIEKYKERQLRRGG